MCRCAPASLHALAGAGELGCARTGCPTPRVLLGWGCLGERGGFTLVAPVMLGVMLAPAAPSASQGEHHRGFGQKQDSGKLCGNQINIAVVSQMC